jgi:hypothetical protein
MKIDMLDLLLVEELLAIKLTHTHGPLKYSAMLMQMLMLHLKKLISTLTIYVPLFLH